MTINETSFFRDGKPFDLLREKILPELIARNSATRRLRIWSAANSTGQEAYSIAMLIAESFPQLAAWDVKIIGTDISAQVIEYARRGRYRRMEVNRGLPARMLVKYLVRHDDEWEIASALRSMCDFRYANLCAPLPELPVFDLVLLRNVLLYFPQQDRSCVFSDVYRQMASGGYLLLGSAEQAEDSTNLFQVQFANDCYFYRPSPAV
jgi:chemotaxis protein methyltransferase CheR